MPDPSADHRAVVQFQQPKHSSQQKHVQRLFALYHFTCQGFTSIACKTAALLDFADHWLLILLSAAGICFYFLLREQELFAQGALKAGTSGGEGFTIAALPARRLCSCFSTSLSLYKK